MKINESIDCFINYISTERRLATRTVAIYTDVLSNFSNFLTAQNISEIEQISAFEVRNWQVSMIEENLAPATVKMELSALRSWFKYLRRQKWVTIDIMAKVTSPKLPKHLPIFFRESEVDKIYTCEELFADNFEGKRDKLLLQILYETGIRLSELTGLKDLSFDFAANTVKVLGKRNKERYIPIENELAHNIQCYFSLKRKIEGCSSAFFVGDTGKPMSKYCVEKVVKKYMSLISNADRISPHIFRHSFATHLLNEGADINAIKELLGHADISATEIYTHVTREHLKETYKHAHPRANKK